MITSKIHNLNVDEKWAECIFRGQKTIEGRLRKDKFLMICVGDIIKWNGSAFHSRVIGLRTYPDFLTFLTTETLEKCLPGITCPQEGVTDVYYKYYTPKDEKKYGVLCIETTTVAML